MFGALHKWLGIPASEQPPNDYRLLGLNLFEDDEEVIDSAADRLLRFLHDLTNGEHGDQAEQISNQVSAARLRLRDPQRKAAYDAQLRGMLEGSPPRPPVPAQPRSPVQAATESAPATPPTAAAPTMAGRKTSRRKPPTRIPSRRRRRRSRLPILLLPAISLLALVFVGVAMGKIKFDQNKMVSLGIPEDIAERLSGGSSQPDDVEFRDSQRSNNEFTDDDLGRNGNSNQSADRQSASNQFNRSDRSVPGRSQVESSRVESSRAERTPSSGMSRSSTDGDLASSSNRAMDRNANDPNVFMPGAAKRPEALSLRSLMDSKNDIQLNPPSEADLNEKLKVVRDLFGQRYREADTNREKIDLAKRIESEADATHDDPVGKYALLRVARDIYKLGGDFDSAFGVVDKIDKTFRNTNVVRQKYESIQDIDRPKGEALIRFIDATIRLAFEGMEDHQFDVAESIFQQLNQTVPSIPRSRAAAHGRVKSLLQEYANAKTDFVSARTKLDRDANDEEASQQVGSYQFFFLGQTEEGLEHLAKSKNARLKTAAQLGRDVIDYDEFARGKLSNDKKIAVADAWRDAANAVQQSKWMNLQCSQEALRWYRESQSSSSGLEAKRVASRITELEARIASIAPRAPESKVAAKKKTNTKRPRVLQTRFYDSADDATDFALIKQNEIRIGMGPGGTGYGEGIVGYEFLDVAKVYVAGMMSARSSAVDLSGYRFGFYVDYSTGRRYTKRVYFHCDGRTPEVLEPLPNWGFGLAPSETKFLPPKPIYEFDFSKDAPADWDGRCWFSIRLKDAGPGRTLNATLRWEGAVASEQSEGARSNDAPRPGNPGDAFNLPR